MPGAPVRQNCSTCPHVAKCYAITTNRGNRVSDQNVAINVLICRLKLRIDTDNTVRNLLSILRPGIVRLAANAFGRVPRGAVDFNVMLADMQSEAIRLLDREYDIGDFLVATAYLFDPRTGYLVRWAKWYAGNEKKYAGTHELRDEFHADSSAYDEDGGEMVEQNDTPSYSPPDADDFVAAAREIIDDGVTLNSKEYRVLVYCMQNANESNAHRHIDGLHLQLAGLTGVSRPRITRLYKRAVEKLRARLIEEGNL